MKLVEIHQRKATLSFLVNGGRIQITAWPIDENHEFTFYGVSIKKSTFSMYAGEKLHANNYSSFTQPPQVIKPQFLI